MKKETLIFRSTLNAPASDVFQWHENPGAFERYNPPWDPVEVVERKGTIKPGDKTVIRMKMGPLSQEWVAEHTEYEPGRKFRDIMVTGPFAHWDHTHLVEPVADDTSMLEDRIEYAVPLGSFGHFFGNSMVKEKLKSVFSYRHETIRLDLQSHQKYREVKPMKVLITGASGLVGTDLQAFLTTGGHEVFSLSRKPSSEEDKRFHWDPASGEIEKDKLEGFDAVVHLAGENIAGGRWTEEKKQKIRDSRVKGTQLLCETLASLNQPPKVLVSASAIGYYGDRGDEEMTEESDPGSGFLCGICKDWEAATSPASDKGIRVVHARIGVILTPKGGALAKMLFPFKMGAGGKIGSGKQYMSWIGLDDVVAAFHHAVVNESVQGPVNLVSPNPVTNLEFTKTLGKVLARPTFMPMPSFGARLAFGEMADELLLASTKVKPVRLLESGYEFRHPELEDALRYLLGKEVQEPVMAQS